MRIEIFESINNGIQGLTDTHMDSQSLVFCEELDNLKSEYGNIEVSVYKIDVYGSRPKKINSLVNIKENKLVKENSNKRFPITFINDEIFKYGSYPTIEEIKLYMQLNN